MLKKVIGLFFLFFLFFSSAGLVNALGVNYCTEALSPCGGGCPITDFSFMFAGYDWDSDPLGVGDISGWDTSCVTDMRHMFAGEHLAVGNFNQPINSWNVSNVVDMRHMFVNSNFNQPLDNWDVSNVVNMGNMFEGTSFNQPLDNWDVSNVVYMANMFARSNFNQPLDNWDVSNVESFSGLFRFNEMYSHPLNSWNTSSATDMADMFTNVDFNQPLDNWDVSNVESFGQMFRYTTFNQDISMWNMSSAKNLGSMFMGARSFNQSINEWDVSNVESISGIFNEHWFYNLPLDNWDTRNVVDMSFAFHRNIEFNQDISMWNTSSVTNMEGMFNGANSFNQPLNSWDVSNVVNMGNMFAGTNFNQPLNNWDVSSVTNMESMFNYRGVDASGFAFYQDISGWDVSSVTNMKYMFEGTTFNQPIGSWNVQSLRHADYMFANSAFNQPLNNWNTQNLRYANFMFANSSFNRPIGSWNTENLISARHMFEGTSFNQPIGAWNVHNLVHADAMFKNTPFNRDVGGWNVNKLQRANSMFENSNMNRNLGAWDIRNLRFAKDMFKGTSMSYSNYDSLLIGWVSAPFLQSSVDFHAGNAKYSEVALNSRNILTNNYGWIITDAGLILPFGCTDPEALNYQEYAVQDDGSCYYNPGCTISAAVNFDPFADFNDGSCDFDYVPDGSIEFRKYYTKEVKDSGIIHYGLGYYYTDVEDFYIRVYDYDSGEMRGEGGRRHGEEFEYTVVNLGGGVELDLSDGNDPDNDVVGNIGYRFIHSDDLGHIDDFFFDFRVLVSVLSSEGEFLEALEHRVVLEKELVKKNTSVSLEGDFLFEGDSSIVFNFMDYYANFDSFNVTFKNAFSGDVAGYVTENGVVTFDDLDVVSEPEYSFFHFEGSPYNTFNFRGFRIENYDLSRTFEYDVIVNFTYSRPVFDTSGNPGDVPSEIIIPSDHFDFTDWFEIDIGNYSGASSPYGVSLVREGSAGTSLSEAGFNYSLDSSSGKFYVKPLNPGEGFREELKITRGISDDLFFVLSHKAEGVTGCVDPGALNYDETMIFGDRSCLYSGIEEFNVRRETPFCGDNTALNFGEDYICVYEIKDFPSNISLEDMRRDVYQGASRYYIDLSEYFSPLGELGTGTSLQDMRYHFEMNVGGELFEIYRIPRYGPGFVNMMILDVNPSQARYSSFNRLNDLIYSFQGGVRVEDGRNVYLPEFSVMIYEEELAFDIPVTLKLYTNYYGAYEEYEFLLTYNNYFPGCTNSGASNYDKYANVDDGSCVFSGGGGGGGEGLPAFDRGEEVDDDLEIVEDEPKENFVLEVVKGNQELSAIQRIFLFACASGGAVLIFGKDSVIFGKGSKASRKSLRSRKTKRGRKKKSWF